MFEQLSQQEQSTQLRMFIIDYVLEHEPEISDKLINAITNSGELLSVMVEAVSAYVIDRTRRMNHEASELFRTSVKTESGVDRLVSNAGLKRGVIEPETATSAAVMESNEKLLTRYDLSHYQANTTGTRYGYKFHALCYGIDDKPLIDVTRNGNQVIQTFTFKDNNPSNVADVEFRRDAGAVGEDGREIGTGRVTGAITPVIGKTPDLVGLLKYMKRPDIAQETDILSLKLATSRSYSVTINAYTNDDPRHFVSKSAIETKAKTLYESKRHNEARVSGFDFAHIALELGAYDVDVIGLDNPLLCNWDEYAECKGLVVNVLGKR